MAARRLMRSLVGLAAVAAVVVMNLAASASAPRRIEIQGHRGARAVLPENSLPAFRYAIELGVDVIELDVVVTRDDVLVVMHDLELKPEICSRRGGGRVPTGFVVREHSREELRAFDCGRKRNPRFPQQKTVPGTTIPTLDEVFDLLASSKARAAASVRFNIEAKRVPGLSGHTPPPDRFAALVVEKLRQRGMVQRSVLQSFDHQVLVAAKRLEPGLRTAALVDGSRPDLVAVARAAGVEVVSPNHLWIDAEDVAALHAAGVSVVPWTVNDEAAWARMLELGVDGIITDDPAALILFLKRRGAR